MKSIDKEKRIHYNNIEINMKNRRILGQKDNLWDSQKDENQKLSF